MPPAGTTFNQKMNKPSKGRDNRKQKAANQAGKQCEAQRASRANQTTTSELSTHQPDPQPEQPRPLPAQPCALCSRRWAACAVEEAPTLWRAGVATVKSLSQTAHWPWQRTIHAAIKVHAPKNKNHIPVLPMSILSYSFINCIMMFLVVFITAPCFVLILSSCKICSVTNITICNI